MFFRFSLSNFPILQSGGPTGLPQVAETLKGFRPPMARTREAHSPRDFTPRSIVLKYPTRSKLERGPRFSLSLSLSLSLDSRRGDRRQVAQVGFGTCSRHALGTLAITDGLARVNSRSAALSLSLSLSRGFSSAGETGARVSLCAGLVFGRCGSLHDARRLFRDHQLRLRLHDAPRRLLV